MVLLVDGILFPWSTNMAAKLLLKSAVAGGLVYGILNVSDSIWITPSHSLSQYRDQGSFIYQHKSGNEEVLICVQNGL